MGEHPESTTDRRRALQGTLQEAYPGLRVSVEPVTTGGFDGFLVWASPPDEGKRTVVYRLTLSEFSSGVVADLVASVRVAMTAAWPPAPV